MNKVRHAYFPAKLQTRDQTDASEPIIEGYFAVIDAETELWDGVFEEIAPGAFDKSLKDNDIRCLFNHRTDMVLGRSSAGTLDLRVDDKGLYGTVTINPNDSEAMNVYQRVKRGDISNCSFGFNPRDEEVINRDDGTVKFIVKEADTLEVSVVTFPAYPQTEVEARKKDIEASRKRASEAWKAKMKGRIQKWH